jgi:hypothetical protein
MLTRQPLYHLSHSTNPECDFSDENVQMSHCFGFASMSLMLFYLFHHYYQDCMRLKPLILVSWALLQGSHCHIQWSIRNQGLWFLNALLFLNLVLLTSQIVSWEPYLICNPYFLWFSFSTSRGELRSNHPSVWFWWITRLSLLR